MQDSTETRTRELINRLVLVVTLFGGAAQILSLFTIAAQADSELPQSFVFLTLGFSMIAVVTVAVCLVPLCSPFLFMTLKRTIAVFAFLIGAFLRSGEVRTRLDDHGIYAIRMVANLSFRWL